MVNAWHAASRHVPNWHSADLRVTDVANWIFYTTTLFYGLQYMVASVLSGVLEWVAFSVRVFFFGFFITQLS